MTKCSLSLNRISPLSCCSLFKKCCSSLAVLSRPKQAQRDNLDTRRARQKVLFPFPRYVSFAISQHEDGTARSQSVAWRRARSFGISGACLRPHFDARFLDTRDGRDSRVRLCCSQRCRHLCSHDLVQRVKQRGGAFKRTAAAQVSRRFQCKGLRWKPKKAEGPFPRATTYYAHHFKSERVTLGVSQSVDRIHYTAIRDWHIRSEIE